MADGKPTVIAGSFFSAKCSDSSIAVGRLVQMDSTDSSVTEMVVKASTADTTIPFGITVTSTSAADQNVTIQIQGICNVSMDGSTIDEGSKIVSAAAGQGAVSTAEDATNQWCVGFALAPSSVANDMIPVLIAPFPLNKGTA